MTKLDVLSAFDEERIEQLTLTTEAELEAHLTRAKKLHDARAWLPAHERIRILERIAAFLAEKKDELARLAAREGGKPLVDSLVEAQRASEGARAAAALLWSRGGREIPMGLTPASEGRFAHTFVEPRGVVGAISAFNHPLNLIVHQVIPAIAVGAPVLVKPASATPLSCRALLDITREAGLPEGFARMVLLPSELGTKLARDPRLGFFSFIGSARVGFELAAQLAPGVTCALEHGGVAPVIVDETADVDKAVPALVKGGYYHAGQVCVSVQRIYIERSRYQAFVDAFVEQVKKLVVGDPLDPKTEVGPLISPKEVERVDEWVKEAVAGGASLATGGHALSKTTYAPTVLLEPTDDARVSKEEVFGPVVCLYPYDALDDAVARANGPDVYFQAAVWTQNLERALSLTRRLNGTTVLVNDHTAFRVDWMPFGGARRSGLGMGGIEASMHDMSIERMAVFRSSAF